MEQKLLAHRLKCAPFWGYSSVGRASALHAEGQGFESLYLHVGSVAERFKALVLKTSVGKPTVSSNLTASAITFLPGKSLL